MATHVQAGWDLKELVDEPIRPSVDARIAKIREMARRFGKSIKRLDSGMDEKGFGRVVKRLEVLARETSVIGGYAALRHAEDTQSDEATSLEIMMDDLQADVANQTLSFELWWKRNVDEENARRLMRGSDRVSGFLRRLRLAEKYTLSEPEEKIMNILGATGAGTMVSVYDKITNAFGYAVRIRGRKRKVTRKEIEALVRGSDSEARECAYAELLGRFRDSGGVLGEIYQSIVTEWKNEGIKIRGYDSAISVRNLDNDVDDASVSSLLRACSANADLFQKFFTLKAKALDMTGLRRYDLYAPLSQKRRRKYRYDDAVRIVLDAWNTFSPELASHAKTVIDDGHVDSSVRPGKRDGAFCSTLAPDIVPYVLVNYTGTLDDVFTLAHELGHAIHSMAALQRSILVHEPSLPVAETASTFSELLLYDALAARLEEDERKVMLSGLLDDLYATIMRQAYFTIFETKAHEMIPGGATVSEVSGAYAKNLGEQFKSSVLLSDEFSSEWLCIPHFYHAPFYCYAYSFGNLLALALFDRFKKEGRSYASSYMEILASGGSEKPEDLLSRYGMRIRSESFWQDGFEYIQRQVRDLARMV